MKPSLLCLCLLLLASLPPARAQRPAVAADAPVPAAPFNLGRERAAYPLDTCVVSGENLEGDMGGPVDYLHQEPGRSPRLVRFCCKSCIRAFKRSPAKYIQTIEAAGSAKPQRAAAAR